MTLIEIFSGNGLNIVGPEISITAIKLDHSVITANTLLVCG